MFYAFLTALTAKPSLRLMVSKRADINFNNEISDQRGHLDKIVTIDLTNFGRSWGSSDGVQKNEM